MWKKFVREYLSFTRRQRRGLYVLGSIILISMLASYFLPAFLSDEEEDHTAFHQAVEEFLAKQKKENASAVSDTLFYFDPNSISTKDWQKLGVQKHTALTIQHYLAAGGHFYEKEDLKDVYGLTDSLYARILPYVCIKNEKKRKYFSASHEDKIILHPFDPNTLSLNGWINLGISESIAHTIRNYINAGGHFYRKEELKKIYGFSKKDYQRLVSYVEIKNKNTRKSRSATSRLSSKDSVVKGRHFHVYINKADSASWSRLYGIGPVFSSRIVHFREALGGFFTIHQIAEVYGLPDSTFQRIKPYLKLSGKAIHKLDVNHSTAEELEGHPYINYSLAKAIVAYRKQHGPFDSVAGIKNIHLIKHATYKKLRPYLYAH